MNDLNIKLLAFDIDGTLMNNQKEFPEINCRALRECERRGIKIALNSGRSFELMRQFAHQMGIDPIMAACNGARLEESDCGSTLEEHCFTREEAERICRTIEESGMYFNVYPRGKNFMGNPDVRLSLGDRYAHHAPGEFGDPGYPYEIVCDRERLWTEGLNGVYKFVVIGDPYDARFDEISAALADMKLSVSSASCRNKEYMPSGIDKGSAVRMICKRLGISTKDVMAFGDQTNDIPMLMAAGHPVAMENAEDSLKACAKYIAPNNDVGGVGLFLYENVLS